MREQKILNWIRNNNGKGQTEDLRRDVEILQEMINHTENITALSVFNVEILRQSSTDK